MRGFGALLDGFVKPVAARDGRLIEGDLLRHQQLSVRCEMQDIFWGVVIIGIGLAMGGSIFMGQFTLINLFFDGLGIFFVGKGLVGMLSQKPEQ